MDDKLYAFAIRMLAGREHSGYELKLKLKKKAFSDSDIDEVIAQLIIDKYLNDERFTEIFVNSKIKRGLGPMRIQLELQQRSVDESLIGAYLDFNQAEWFERAREVRCKRFGENLPMEINEKAKQIRFLQQRGFMQQHIMNVISSNDFDD
jgi:regulatory protein